MDGGDDEENMDDNGNRNGCNTAKKVAMMMMS